MVADLPFGSYQVNPEQALTTAIRFMKEAGAHAVKLEGGARPADFKQEQHLGQKRRAAGAG